MKKAKEKLKKEEEEFKEVEFVNGKLIIRELTASQIGKKRRREDKYSTFEKIIKEDKHDD